eukprot:1376535-Alexandrium_andersonii.AAC.1
MRGARHSGPVQGAAGSRTDIGAEASAVEARTTLLAAVIFRPDCPALWKERWRAPGQDAARKRSKTLASLTQKFSREVDWKAPTEAAASR